MIKMIKMYVDSVIYILYYQNKVKILDMNYLFDIFDGELLFHL